MISSLETLHKILDLARKLCACTPYSLYILLDSLEIFKPHSRDIKKKYEELEPQNFPSFPIFPSEILFITFPNILSCPAVYCKNFLNFYEEINWAKDKICPLCREKGRNKNFTKKEFPFILFDLRLKEQKLKDFGGQGLLPKMQFFEADDIKDITKIKNKILSIADSQSQEFHYVLVTNETEKYSEIETELYQVHLSEGQLLGIQLGLQFNDAESKFEEKKVKSFIKDNKKESKTIRNDIVEYKALKELGKALVTNKHRHVSFIIGGYKGVHQLSLKLGGVPINLHDKEKCLLCKEEAKAKNKNKKEKFPSMKEEEFEEFKNKNGCFVFFAKSEKEYGYFLLSQDKISFVIKKESKNTYIPKYQYPRWKILAVSAQINRNDSTVNILISKNISQTDLENIYVDFRSVEKLDEFFKVYYS